MKSFALSLLLLGGLSAAHAQDHGTQIPAPIERREVTVPPATPWPSDQGLKPGTVLLVLTFSAEQPALCRLVRIAPDQLFCTSNKGPRLQAVYDRSEVERIDLAPKGQAALHIAEAFSVTGGGISLGLGMLCGVDGGPVCKGPAVTGLSLLAGGVVLHVVRRVRERHARADPARTLYLVPGGPKPVLLP